MTERSRQVTYRKGRSFAAYLYLSHPTVLPYVQRDSRHVIGVRMPCSLGRRHKLRGVNYYLPADLIVAAHHHLEVIDS